MSNDAIDPNLSDASAILVNARMVADAYGQFLVGDVYGDDLGRWDDGRTIHTSRVCERIGDSTFRTVSGSLFTIHSWAVEPCSSRQTDL